MTVYVVEYRRNRHEALKLSQDAYWTLDEAIRFVKGRANNPTLRYEVGDYSEWVTEMGEEYFVESVTLPDRKEVQK